MEINIRDMEKEELHRIREIDRSEKVRLMYVYEGGSLKTVEQNNDVPRWNEAQVEENIKMLAAKLEGEGKLVGAFDENLLVGIAVLGNTFIGEHEDELQMSFMYVSDQYRRQGIAKRLMDRVCELAKERGAKRLYISATETESAVGFYLNYGCTLASKVNEDLYSLEPEDIHMIKEL
ncbi:GNAT family N-acetyltransferase [Aureibacillus halotolerans]|uniref:Acetyltransferase (GNAT) family protein n=1 Tax=Aureibacillus halotolerans TaxID=1508390 RepID=A0A4R6TWI1_9BACI|nr:GNAT family N-acetyltransferase [Aureibacillus halotolerans]TDQ36613.1 acetyltransferase (GNAT) family protein [Aureibacillus halotolerans]